MNDYEIYYNDKFFQYHVGYFLQLWKQDPWRVPNWLDEPKPQGFSWPPDKMTSAKYVAYLLHAIAAGQLGTMTVGASMRRFLRSAGATSPIASALTPAKSRSSLQSATSVLAEIDMGNLRSSIYLPLRSLILHR